MAQAGVSPRPQRARRADVWLEVSEQDMWTRRAGRAPGEVRRRPDAPPTQERAVRGIAAPSRLAAAQDPATPSWAAPRDEVTGRRTVTITGRGAERYDPRFQNGVRQRPHRPAHERPGFRPDRMALWAVVLGVVLILVAATSSHAAALRWHATAASSYRPALSGHAGASAAAARVAQRSPRR